MEGKKLEEVKLTRLSLDLPEDEYIYVKEQAGEKSLSMSVFIRKLIWNSMKERKKSNERR